VLLLALNEIRATFGVVSVAKRLAPGPDPAAHSIAGLDDDDIGALRFEGARRRQAGQSGAGDQNSHHTILAERAPVRGGCY